MASAVRIRSVKKIDHLDFLAPPPRPWAGFGLVLLACALLAAAANASWQVELRNRQDSARLEQRLARLQPPAPRKLSEAERLQLAAAARVASELRAPWDDLLATFEEHGQADIGLLKLEPDARARVVRITGQARDARALFAYLRALEADPRLVEVSLTTQQAENDTPGKPLRFTIQAGWRAAPSVAKDSS
jgi:Tfp pilus assembly protein PilN